MTHGIRSAERQHPCTRVLLVVGCIALTAAALCFNSRASAAGQPSTPGTALPATDDAIVHALNRIGFGPTPTQLVHVRRVGLSRYIDEQLFPERIADVGMDARLAHLTTLDDSSRELAERYFIPALRERLARQRAEPDSDRPQGDSEPRRAGTAPRPQAVVLGELSEQRILRAVYSDKQLQEVLVDFWFNHFNVFAGKGAVRQFVTEYERETIRPHVLGKFRELLGATAKDPAMLFYLDNWMSADPNISAEDAARLARSRRQGSRTNRGGGRQRSRGELVDNAERDRPSVAAQGNRTMGLNENYARELLELHTLGVDGGYTQLDVVEVARAFTGWTLVEPRRGGIFRFEPAMHDNGAKTVLGKALAGGGGIRDGEQVLDLLARHPSTARFIATKLVRRLVADEPPLSLVERAADRFRATDGDIREVVRTIVTAPEFYAPQFMRAKVKTPFEFVVSALRATNAEVTRAGGVTLALRELGMPLYFAQPPTGYKDTADAWVNTGALVGRMNVALALVTNQRGGVRVDAKAVTAEAVVPGALSEATSATIAEASEPAKVVALLLGSPEFQRR